jgi:hypothetical protein
MPSDFFNGKNSIVFLCRRFMIQKNSSIMSMQSSLVEYMMVDSLNSLVFIHSLRDVNQLLPKSILDLGRVEIRSYLIGNFAYESCPFLLKNFKPNAIDLAFFDKRKFDQSMNFERVVIEHAFGALKN